MKAAGVEKGGNREEVEKKVPGCNYLGGCGL